MLRNLRQRESHVKLEGPPPSALAPPTASRPSRFGHTPRSDGKPPFNGCKQAHVMEGRGGLRSSSPSAMLLDLGREAPSSLSARMPSGGTYPAKLSKSSSTGAIFGLDAGQPVRKQKTLPKLASKQNSNGGVAWSMRVAQAGVGRDRLAALC